MFKAIRGFFSVIWFLHILSKRGVLMHLMHNSLPLHINLLMVFGNILISPIGFFRSIDWDFGDRLCLTLQDLGPIYIKFGQTLSTRPDLIGEDNAKALQTLQDSLPAFEFEVVEQLFEEQFDQKIRDVFESFDEKPVAAASIAQVHKAKLHTGEIVAVKILRPDIREKYQNDLRFLEYIANVSDKYIKKVKRLKLKEVIEVFRQSMKSELDLRLEAAAASRIRDNFANDLNLLKVPDIYWKYTKENILTLEWIEGVSIYDKEHLDQLDIDCKKVASDIAVIFFNQAYRDGFFHADLHPGNILIEYEGRITMLDFGIVGILPEKDRFAIAEILYAFLTKDYLNIAKIHQRVGYIPKDTNLELFAQSCRAIAEPITGLAIKDISIGDLLSQLFKVTEEYGMETQPQLILLQKTMVVLEGIGHNLDPDINMWQLAEPWIKKWAAKNISPEAKILRSLKHLLDKYCDEIL